MNKKVIAKRLTSVTDIGYCCPHCYHRDCILENLWYPKGVMVVKCKSCYKEIEIEGFKDE